MDIGREIKRLRKMYKLSAKDAADYIGVSQWRLESWEGKGIQPNEEDKNAIESYFGVHVTDLDKLGEFKFSKREPKILEHTIEVQKNIEHISTIDSTIRDLARTGITLAEANKLLSEANNKLAESNNKLAENNRMVIDMHKVNSSYAPGSSSPLVTRSASVTIAEFLAKEYSIPQNEILEALGKLVFAHSMAIESKDIEKNVESSGSYDKHL